MMSDRIVSTCPRIYLFITTLKDWGGLETLDVCKTIRGIVFGK